MGAGKEGGGSEHLPYQARLTMWIFLDVSNMTPADLQHIFTSDGLENTRDSKAC